MNTTSVVASREAAVTGGIVLLLSTGLFAGFLWDIAYTALLVLTVLATLIAFAAPLTWALISLVAIIASPVLERFVPGAGLLDEAVVVSCVIAFSARRLLIHRRLRRLPGGWAMVGFAALGMASAAINEVSLGTSLTGLLVACKAYLFGFAIVQLDVRSDNVARLARLGAMGSVLLLFMGLVNLVAPSWWSGMMLISASATASPIPGLPSIAGPFGHPAAWGRLMAILLVGVVTYQVCVRRSRAGTVLAVALGLGALLSFRIKTLSSALVGLLVALRSGFSRVGYLVLVVAIGIGVALNADLLQTLFGDKLNAYLTSSTARVALGLGSLTVASNYFPFGAGFGRYGSSPAATDYSPEYVAMGFPGRYGLGNGAVGQDDSFLTDTQWPAILGEAGWIGALCFALAVVFVLASLRRQEGDSDEPYGRWLREFAIAAMVVLLIESIAAPAFASAPGYPFLFGVPALWLALQQTAREDSPTDAGSVAGAVDPRVQ